MARSRGVARHQSGNIVGWYDNSGRMHRCKAKNPADCAKEAGMALKALERGQLPQGKTYGKCRVGSTPGVCLEHGPAPAGKKWVRGKCPGAANIQCLVDIGAKEGRRGGRGGGSAPSVAAPTSSKLPQWWPYAAFGVVGTGVVGYLFVKA